MSLALRIRQFRQLGRSTIHPLIQCMCLNVQSPPQKACTHVLLLTSAARNTRIVFTTQRRHYSPFAYLFDDEQDCSCDTTETKPNRPPQASSEAQDPVRAADPAAAAENEQAVSAQLPTESPTKIEPAQQPSTETRETVDDNLTTNTSAGDAAAQWTTRKVESGPSAAETATDCVPDTKQHLDSEPLDPTQRESSLDDMLLSFMLSAAADAANGEPQSSAQWARIARQLGWHHKRYTVGSVLTEEQASSLKLSPSQRVSLRVSNLFPRLRATPRLSVPFSCQTAAVCFVHRGSSQKR